MMSDPALKHVPVIMISAVTEIDSVVKCIELGATDYLPKPFNPVLLKARVGATLEKKRLRDKERLYAKSLERELEIGREIQKSFLPEELPAVAGWEIAARFRPARQVAGDFYDAFPLPSSGRIGLVVADVCDKGSARRSSWPSSAASCEPPRPAPPGSRMRPRSCCGPSG